MPLIIDNVNYDTAESDKKGPRRSAGGRIIGEPDLDAGGVKPRVEHSARGRIRLQ